MLIVYPDTNAFFADLSMTRQMSQALLEQLFVGETEVAISPVVVAEARRRATEMAAASSEEVATAVNAAARRHGINPDEHTSLIQPLCDAIAATREALAPLLAHPACSVAEWPAVTTEELVRRELDRRPPTRLKDGQTIGLRDTIIWHGLLELMESLDEDDEVLFVTNDGGFLQEGGSLAPDLRSELESLDPTAQARVRVTNRLENALVELRQRRQLFTAREGLIRNAVIDHLASLEGEVWSQVDRTNSSPLPFGVDEAMISAVDAITVTDVELGTPARVEASAEITVSAFMRSDEYIQEHANSVDWMHGELDDPMIGVDFYLTLYVEAEVGIHSSGDAEEAWIEDATVSWSH